MSNRAVEPARLDRIAAFAGLSVEDRARVAERLHEVAVEAGASLATQGDNAYLLFVIEAGEAEVRKDGEVIRRVGPGDVIGEIGVIATGTRTASVIATSPMQLVAMFVRDFKDLERSVPALAESVRATMAERIARAPF